MKKTKGFTILEAMIVVAIIGLLVTIFLPMFFHHKGQPETTGSPTVSQHDCDNRR